MDEVEGLGQFIELEVVFIQNQDPAEGHAIAKSLMAQLRIDEQDLIDVAYVDLSSMDKRSASMAGLVHDVLTL